MLSISRKSKLSRADDRVLIYSSLFLICALASTLGAGDAGLLAFLPAAVLLELVAKWRQSSSGSKCLPSHG